MVRGESKLIIASVRLPVSLSRADGRWTAAPSPGGLATALRAVAAKRPFTWVGYPGSPVAEEDRDDVTATLREHGAIPVFIGRDEVKGFYEEFSNRVLWPLLHALPQPTRFDRKAWKQYKTVNERFAQIIADQASPGDTIWVHDYQLTLVPQLLRERGLDCNIGFFLHIPFPSSETYRTLPVREAILRGMLGADLIGFHAYEYVSHFRNSSLRVLGHESDPEKITLNSHDAWLGVLPIGIEPEELQKAARSPEVMEEYEHLRERYAGKKVVVGVDRLDYTKGLPHKLIAFQEFLESNPELREKVVLIQVAAPSRQRVAEYQHLQREIDELVGHINGRSGTLEAQPVVYLNQHVPRERLTALYRLAEVALVTPVRDGMNMVSLEYIAARGDDPGTLILSEFAGAAACLPGARLVNPHNPSQIAAVLAEVLLDGPDREAFEHMREFVTTNTSLVWAQRFLARLESIKRERPPMERLRVDRPPAAELVAGARQPLLVVDYDGTLCEHTAVPSQASPSRRIRELLAELAKLGVVYLVSGRAAGVMDRWFGDLPIGLVCEHGLTIKHPGQSWAEPPSIDAETLTEMVAPMFRDFCERTPGSKVEYKAASIAWHYRAADPKLGAWQAKELRSLLENRLAGQPYSVLAGARVIEVRHVQMSKGNVMLRLLERHPDADLIVAAGDDRTDEEMFEALVRSGHGRVLMVHVGGGHSAATFTVPFPSDLVDQLELMVETWRAERLGS